MTKNKKIEILLEDNQRLSNENNRYSENTNEELSKKMRSEIREYINVNDKIVKEYEQINRLKWYGSFLKIRFNMLKLKLKIKSALGL